MVKKELRVKYDGPIDPMIDHAIEEAIAPFGFRRWASGVNMEDGKRDLAFDQDLNDSSDKEERC